MARVLVLVLIGGLALLALAAPAGAPSAPPPPSGMEETNIFNVIAVNPPAPVISGWSGSSQPLQNGTWPSCTGADGKEYNPSEWYGDKMCMCSESNPGECDWKK